MKTSTNKIMAFLVSLLISAGFSICCFEIPAVQAAISARGNINLLTYAMTVILFCISYLLISLFLTGRDKPCLFQKPKAALGASIFLFIALLTYAMTVILFCISYLLISLFLTGRDKPCLFQKPKAALGASIFLFIANLLFLIRMFQLETEIYGSFSSRYIWQILPFWLVASALIAEAVFFLSFVRKSRISSSSWGLFALYGTLTVLIGYNFYTPEVFLRNGADRLHMNAYFNSIYNVLHGSPYTEYTTSIYGHYGILYKLPMKLLGNGADRLHMNAYFNSIYNVLHGSPYTEYTTSIYGHYGILYKLPMKLLGGDHIDFILLNSLAGALTFLAMFVALHFMVKNNLLRILGAVAISFPVLAMRSGVYWQLWPHRVLFMSLMLCYMAFCLRYNLLRILGAVAISFPVLAMRSGVYWQLWPHRVLFMSLMLCYMAFCLRYQKLNWLTCILGYVLAFIGILWNTESGLFCAAAWAGFWILRSLCLKKNQIMSNFMEYRKRTFLRRCLGRILDPQKPMFKKEPNNVHNTNRYFSYYRHYFKFSWRMGSGRTLQHCKRRTDHGNQGISFPSSSILLYG